MNLLDFLEVLFCMKPKEEEPQIAREDILISHIPTINAVKENTPDEIILKERTFNTNNIPEYKGDYLKKFEFRPSNFSQFIGQEKAKAQLKTAIKKIKRGIKSHIFVDGIQGHGKTTLIQYVLPNELDKNDTLVIYRVGKQVDEECLEFILKQINLSKEKYVLFFIDEIDSMDKKMIKVLNPIIESFQINGLRIKPFIFVCATINKHILKVNNPDTLDRISTHIKFSRYSDEHIATIINQYKTQLYPQDIVKENIVEKISLNSKFNPRTAIAMLEDYIVEQNIDKVFNGREIILDGLTKKDIDILKILNERTRPIGANALSMKAKLSEKEYITEFEPFLVEYNYIDRVPSRIITEKGKKILKELK